MIRLLHVGCGGARLNLPGHEEVRIDCNPDVDPDLVADMRAIPLPPHEADVVYASHCLEHVCWGDALPMLRHWRDLLKPGGKVVIQVPDLHQVMELGVLRGLDVVAYMSPSGPVTPRSMLYGHEVGETGPTEAMQHRCGYTRQTLHKLLTAAGFTDIEFGYTTAQERVTQKYNLHAEAVAP